MDKNYLELIETLSQAPGVSGFEDIVVNAARSYCEGFAPIREDSIRNLYIGRYLNSGTRPVVMLDAHSDEVGFMIRHINPNGTLGFLTLGGIRPERHEGARVRVRNAEGTYIPGLISCRPPHFSRDGGAMEAVIDIGATSAEEAREKFRIRIGEPCVPDVEFNYDSDNDLIFSKALDCRIGCAALLAAMEQLKDEDLAVDVIGALTSQEEIGDRGAVVAARVLQPAVSIVFEGAPADDTFATLHETQTALKRGPMIRLIDNSMISNPRYARFALDLAEAKGIPAQVAVRSGGGTNGGSIHTAGNSVPTIVISVPVRHIHSPNGICSYIDFENTVKLAVEVIRGLNPAIIDSF